MTITLEKLTDEAILQGFKKTRNDYYFKLLIDRYQNLLFTSSLKVLGNANEAEEVVQETFIKVWRNCHNFRDGAHFSRWLFTINQNLCKDSWRTKRRRLIYEGEQITSRMAEPIRVKESEYTEQKDRLAACLEKIPKSQKEVIILRDLQGCTYKEIVRLTGLPCGTVRSRLHYGRKKLKRLLCCEPNRALN